MAQNDKKCFCFGLSKKKTAAEEAAEDVVQAALLTAFDQSVSALNAVGVTLSPEAIASAKEKLIQLNVLDEDAAAKK